RCRSLAQLLSHCLSCFSISRLALLDALPIYREQQLGGRRLDRDDALGCGLEALLHSAIGDGHRVIGIEQSFESAPERVVTIKSTDRKSTRLNSSHVSTSFAVFCLHRDNTIGA